MTHFIFDCDDVLLDWQKGFAAYLRSRGLDVHIDGPAEWCISHWIGCTPNEARRWIEQFNTSPAFGKLDEMTGAHNALWEVLDRGNTIDILTACGDSATTRQRRHDNLNRLFSIGDFHPFEEIKFLPLGSSKSFKLLDYVMKRSPEELVLVEDNFKNASAGALLGIKSFCVRRNHNRSDEAADMDGRVIWIDQISEVLEKV